MSGPLQWERDGRDWPHAAASRFVDAGGLRWHVQRMGTGPALLLLHGTGASTHSWRALLPHLAEHFTVIAPDLPGHAFSAPLPAGRTSLPGMAAAVAALLEVLGVRPALAVGHSAGAAILSRMALDGRLDARLVIGLNAALLPFEGWAGFLYAPMARLLSLNPFVPWLLSWRAQDAGAVRRLIASTGSRLDAQGIDFYARLIRSPGHVAGVLAMTANWDLEALMADLPRLRTPLLLVAGAQDGTVPPEQAARVAAAVPAARVQTLPGLGHLAHEEAPADIAALIERAAHDAGVRVAA